MGSIFLLRLLPLLLLPLLLLLLLVGLLLLQVFKGLLVMSLLRPLALQAIHRAGQVAHSKVCLPCKCFDVVYVRFSGAIAHYPLKIG